MCKNGKVLLAAVLIMTLILTGGALALTDDYSGHWSAQYINDAFARGWMTGDGSGNFRPEAAITRGEFAVMLWRALNQPEPQRQCPFADVMSGAFYYKAVAALFEKGVVNGQSSTSFGPGVTLTREMGCTMLARAYNLSAVNANDYQRFADAAAVSEWARAAVSVLVEKNYIAGVGDNKVAPKQPLKRGEMAKLLITVANGVAAEQAAASTASQQNAMAAITAYVSGPTISIKQEVLGSDEVHITVTVTDTWDISFVGWRESEKGATYKSKTDFKQLGRAMQLNDLNKNGWYAIYAENKNGFGSFKLFEVTAYRENSPIVKPEQKVLPSGMVRITVGVTPAGSGADYAIEYIGYRKASAGDTFSTNNGFTKVEDLTNKKFEIEDPEKDYGWYAVCAIDKGGRFGYHLIEVEKPKTSCTVTFNSRGGSAVSSIPGVAYGAKISAPATPTKGTDIFGGWYTEEECTNAWDFVNNTVKGDLILYAKWTSPPVAPTITTESLPDGKVDDAYTDTTLTANGTTPITWSVSGLPPGLRLDGDKIVGTPTADGTFDEVTVTASNGTLPNATKTFTIVIAPL